MPAPPSVSVRRLPAPAFFPGKWIEWAGGRARTSRLSSAPNTVSLFLVFQLSIEQAQTVAEQVEMKAKVVQSEVKAVTARHKKALEERECELLWKVTGACVP